MSTVLGADEGMIRTLIEFTARNTGPNLLLPTNIHDTLEC